MHSPSASTTHQPDQQQERRHGIRSIRSRLLIGFIAIALLPLIAVTIGSIIIGYQDGHQQALDQLESVASLKNFEIRNLEQSLHNELSSVLKEEFSFEWASVVLKLATKNRFYSFYSGGMRERLTTVLRTSPNLREIMLTDIADNIVLSTNRENEGTRADLGRITVSELQGSKLEILHNEGGAEPGLIIAVPILDVDDETIGAIVGRINLATISGILSNAVGIGETEKTYLYIPDTNSLIASANNSLIYLQPPAEFKNAGFYTDYRGTSVLGINRPQPELDMRLIIEQDRAEVLRMISKTVMVNSWLAIISVLIGVVVAVLLGRGISRPLVNLVETASQIADGDLEQVAKVDQDDEIGSLAHAFNRMTSQLRDLINDLELRVNIRTAEQQAAVNALQRKALQMEISANVSRVATSILNLDDLLARVVDLIQQVFGYYLVQISLIDPANQKLEIKASSGNRVITIKDIPIHSRSLNSEAIKSNAIILVNDISLDNRFLPDPDLPNTESELVVPLRLGTAVIGTLDIHSDQKNAFTQDDALVFQNLGDQIAISIENAKLYEQSQRLAILEERNRLARDLHDSVTQSLYSLRLLAEGWRREAHEFHDPNMAEYFNQVGKVSDQALREMRLLIYELLPPVLEKEGLIGALHHRLDAVEKRAGLKARVIADDIVDLPSEVEIGLYWIAQEALTNALKHSKAESITLYLKKNGDQISLEVRDDGIGFNPDEVSGAGGMGLKNIQARAELLHGTSQIISEPGTGTRIIVTVPTTPDMTRFSDANMNGVVP